MKKPALYFDMDGTLADLYGFENWLPLLRAENTKPYRHAEPMKNLDVEYTNSLLKYLSRKGMTVQIISWCSKGSSKNFERRTAAAKKDWLKKFFPGIFFKSLFLSYGVPKNSAVDAKGNYLFDDSEEVGRAWEAAGGIWVDVKKENICDVLKEIAAQ